MGLDCSAELILGVPLELKKRIVEKTKYDPDTGNPYTIEEEENLLIIKDTNIVVPKDTLYEYDDDDDDCMRGGFVHQCASYIDDRGYFIGIRVAYTGSHRSSSELWTEVEDPKEDDLERLKKVLSEMGYSGMLKYYLLQSISY